MPPPPTPPPTPTPTPTHTLSLSLSRANRSMNGAFPYWQCASLSRSHSLFLTHNLSLLLSPTPTHSQSHSLSLSHSQTHSLSLTLLLPRTLSLTHSPSHPPSPWWQRACERFSELKSELENVKSELGKVSERCATLERHARENIRIRVRAVRVVSMTKV